MIKWTEDWVAFIDGVLQLPILRIQDMYLPTRITHLVIDPEQHAKNMQSLEGDLIGTEHSILTLSVL